MERERFLALARCVIYDFGPEGDPRLPGPESSQEADLPHEELAELWARSQEERQRYRALARSISFDFGSGSNEAC